MRKPGGKIEFIPHLIHNASGIGRQIVATDLNHDGVLDITDETHVGTFGLLREKGATD